MNALPSHRKRQLAKAQRRARRRRRLRRLGLVAGVTLAAVGGLLLIAMVSWPPITDVTTGSTPEYPDIQPQVLRYSPELVLARAVEAVESMSRWRLAAVEAERGQLQAVAEMPVLGWEQEVTIRVETYGAGSLVNVRSQSRGGRGDFGQNARNIRAFQQALEAKLSLARQTIPP